MPQLSLDILTFEREQVRAGWCAWCGVIDYDQRPLANAEATLLTGNGEVPHALVPIAAATVAAVASASLRRETTTAASAAAATDDEASTISSSPCSCSYSSWMTAAFETATPRVMARPPTAQSCCGC